MTGCRDRPHADPGRGPRSLRGRMRGPAAAEPTRGQAAGRRWAGDRVPECCCAARGCSSQPAAATQLSAGTAQRCSGVRLGAASSFVRVLVSVWINAKRLDKAPLFHAATASPGKEMAELISVFLGSWVLPLQQLGRISLLRIQCECLKAKHLLEVLF